SRPGAGISRPGSTTAALDLGEAPGERVQQVRREVRRVVEQLLEAAAVDHLRGEVARRRHRRVAGLVDEQRQLAEVVAGLERRDLLTVALDPGGAAGEDDELAAQLALADEGAAR